MIIMTKKELMNRYQEVLNEKKEAFEADKVEKSKKVSKKEAEFYGEVFLDLIKDTLASGEDVRLVNFGDWKIKGRKSRKGRNPQTGEDLQIEAKNAIVFKVGKGLNDAIAGLEVRVVEDDAE